MKASLVFLFLVIPTTAHAGYTIVVRDQVTPQYVSVHGTTGPETRLNNGPAPKYPSSVSRPVCFSPGFSIYSSSANRRTEVWEDSAGTATDGQVLAACPTLRAQVSADVLAVRKLGLSKVTSDNAGVIAVYEQNYQAAQAVLAGAGDTTITKNGQTASAYLAGMGANLGMSAQQFATWLISENQRVGAAASRVENEYLRLTYAVIPTDTSVADLLGLADVFKRFCGL